jgi:gluconate kinase
VGHVVIVIGPKAVGKTTIARLLASKLAVEHIDPDLLAGSFLAAGAMPDPSTGWLEPIVEHVHVRATDGKRPVLVEATGAWESDWMLRPRLEALGHRVSEVWMCAPLATMLQRLPTRDLDRFDVTEAEAVDLYHRATAAASGRTFDLTIDTTEPPDNADLVQRFSTLLASR